MKRDDLIEELRRCPYNSEVSVRVALTPDYMDREFRGKGDCAVVDFEIQSVTQIPSLLIDCTA